MIATNLQGLGNLQGVMPQMPASAVRAMSEQDYERTTLVSGPALGIADWHVTDTAAVIQNKRREGWSDAKITTWLLSEENRDTTGGVCPWGCDDEKVAAAFEYLASGQLPGGVTVTRDPAKAEKSTALDMRPWYRRPLVLAAIGGGVLLAGGAYFMLRAR